MSKDKLYQKWWFWVVLAIVFIFTMSSMLKYARTQNDLDSCLETLDDVIEAWEEYDDAIEGYCVFDKTNPLCEALV